MCFTFSSNNKSQMVYKVNMVGLEKNSKKDLGEENDNERFELLITVWKSTAEKILADSKQKAVKNKMGGILLDWQ